MKESLIGSVVDTVTGAVTSTTDALTGTTTSPPASSDSPTTSAPVSTTAAPRSTTSTASVTPSAQASTTASPSPTTSTPVSTTSAPSSTTSSPSTTTASDWSSVSDSDSSAAATQTPSANSDSTASTTEIPRSDSTSAPSSISSSSSQLRGGPDQSHVGVVAGSHSGSSSNEGDAKAGIASVTKTGISTASVVGLALGALGALLLIILVVNWCLRSRRRQYMSSIHHVRLGATGDLPVFNTQGTERFQTSSTSLSLGPIHTAQVESVHDSTTSGAGRSGLWEDEVITAMRIPLEKLTTSALLSSGGYGEVYRGLYRDESVAVKVLLPEKQKDLGQISTFLAEIKTMATIDHPCIVQFIGVAWDSLSDLSAVMEFMEGGDLRSLLDRFELDHKPRGFDLGKARIALQTARALTYLHSLDPKVLHRDLKSKNILLSAELNAKLSDFGVARTYSFSSMTAAVGTSLWMAPEVMLGDRYDASADIFSFGVVLSELDSHLYPYAAARMTTSGQQVPDAALLQLVAMGRVSVNFSASSPMLAELGRACVRLDPTTRPSASEVHYRLQLLLQSFELYTL